MKTSVKIVSAAIVLAMLAFNILGCSGGSAPSASSDSVAPTDEEVLKAVNNSGLFTGGAEKYMLKSPIEIQERGNQNSDGSWSVKVRISFVSTAGGRESRSMERTPVFRFYKAQNSAGKTIWKAVVGS